MKRLFVENLGLKLLALALATVLYYTLKTTPPQLIPRHEGHQQQHP